MTKSLYSHHNDVLLHLLRSRRESLRLRQLDLAQRLGGGQATVSKVESGSRRLDVIELRNWLRALEMDLVSFATVLESSLKSHPTTDWLTLVKQLEPLTFGNAPEADCSGEEQ